MAPPKSYFVTETGAAFKASDVLAARFKQPLAIPVPEVVPSGNPDLPVVEGGDVVAGKLYASAAGPSRQLYLPRYRVARDGSGRDVIALRAVTRTLTVEIDADPPSAAGATVAPMPHTLTAALSYWLLTPSGQRATQVRLPIPTLTALGGTRFRLEVTIEDTGGVGRIALALMKPEQGALLELTAVSQIGVPRGKKQIRVKESLLFGAMGIDLAALRPQLAHFATPKLAMSPPAEVAPVKPVPESMVIPSEVAPGPFKPVPHAFRGNLNAMRPLRARHPGLGEVEAPPEPPPPEPPPPESLADTERPAKPAGAFLTTKFRKPVTGMGALGTLRPRGPRTPLDPPVSDAPPPEVSTAREETAMTLPLTRPHDAYSYIYELGASLLPEGLFLSPVAPLAGALDDVPLWRDTASEAFYYLPRRFLLARSDLPPFAPGLFAVFGEPASEGAEPMVDLSVYLLPHLDVADMGRARERARLALGGTAGPQSFRFFLQEPSVRELVWQLPAESSGPDAMIRAEGARVSFREGIQDTISLSYGQFKRLLVALLATQIGKVPGAVTYDSPTVPGRGDALPAVLSFREMAGRAVDCRLLGNSASVAFGVAVALENTIESDVVIRQQVSLRVGDGVYLGALYGPSGQLIPDRTRIPAGGTLEVSLLGSAPGLFLGGLVSDDVTVAWQAVPTPDQLRRLLTVVLAGPQWSPVREPLTVETLPDFFGPRGARRPIRALRVEVEDDVTLEVSADAPTGTVLLRQPFVEALLDDPAARSFRYRVTNLYQDGSVGTPADWTPWDGGSPLLVAPGPWES